MEVFFPSTIREIEQSCNEPAHELMKRAGEALARHIKKLGGKVAIMCGSGNNGGDGYAAAVVLKQAGIKIDIYEISEKVSPISNIFREQAIKSEVLIFNQSQSLKDYDFVVDALLGIGLDRNLEGKYLEWVRLINKSSAYVIACDIPSGLNSYNGFVMGECVNADMTVTFIGCKSGLLLNDGQDYCGDIVIEDIGLKNLKGDITVIENPILDGRKKNSHKGDYSNILIIAGSKSMWGAAAISAEAALRSGAGLVSLGVPKDIMQAYIGRFAESMVMGLPSQDGRIIFDQDFYKSLMCGKIDTIVLGMGLGASDEVEKILNFLTQNFEGTLIIDADGLNSLNTQSLKSSKCKIILTPHVAEFSRLTKLQISHVLSDPVVLAQNFAKEHKCIVVLKSNTTVITNGITTYLNIAGTPAQAKGGSGDILAGVIGSITSLEKDLLKACAIAAYICGSSAAVAAEELGVHSVIASDVVKNLPYIIKEITQNNIK